MIHLMTRKNLLLSSANNYTVDIFSLYTVHHDTQGSDYGYTRLKGIKRDLINSQNQNNNTNKSTFS